MKPLEIKLTISKGSFDDWWVLERIEHDNKTWNEPMEYGSRYCMSRRLEKTTDIEGPAREWSAIRKAILDETTISFTRCSIEHRKQGFLIESPRNSQEPILISASSAIYLANEIERKLG